MKKDDNSANVSYSYVLRKEMDEDYIFFHSWKAPKSKHPLYSDKLRFAKHWKQSLNCKRFLGRNAETLKGFVVYKVIKERCCLYCGNTLDREMRVSALYCNDHCRKEYFNDNN